jgi:hypothetical protein
VPVADDRLHVSETARRELLTSVDTSTTTVAPLVAGLPAGRRYWRTRIRRADRASETGNLGPARLAHAIRLARPAILPPVTGFGPGTFPAPATNPLRVLWWGCSALTDHPSRGPESCCSAVPSSLMGSARPKPRMFLSRLQLVKTAHRR